MKIIRIILATSLVIGPFSTVSARGIWGDPDSNTSSEVKTRGAPANSASTDIDSAIKAAEEHLDELKARKAREGGGEYFYRKVGDKFVKVESILESDKTPADNRCLEYRTKGDADAKRISSGNWVFGGCFGGLLGAIPGALVCFIATQSTPAVPPYLLPSDPVLSRCYEHGYTERAREMNSDDAIMGCVAGVATLAVIVIAVEIRINGERAGQ